jgi:hypothetical protein
MKGSEQNRPLERASLFPVFSQKKSKFKIHVNVHGVLMKISYGYTD